MLNTFFSQFPEFQPEEINALEQLGKRHTTTARTLIFQGDRSFTNLLFIESGLMRAFRLIDGEDYTYFFFLAGDFAVDFHSFLTETPSSLFFETLAETNYLEFQKKDIYALYQAYPRFEKLGRLMAEAAFLSAADRLRQHQTDDLKTRYLKLIAKNPGLFQMVSQHHIASYLGVKPQSLSRIRAELSGKKY